jgi:hypothetical protein
MAPDRSYGVFQGSMEAWFLLWITQLPKLDADFDSGLFRLYNLNTLILTADFYIWIGCAVGATGRTEDAYSLLTHDPTFDIFRGPCSPILWFVFPVGLENDYCSLSISFHPVVRFGPLSALHFLQDLWVDGCSCQFSVPYTGHGINHSHCKC